MTPEELISQLRALLAAYDAPPPDPGPTPVHVASRGNIQAAIDAGAALITLEAGGDYTGGLTLSAAVEIRGNGATLVASGVPAIRVLPGASDISLCDLTCRADDYNGAAVLLGANDTSQTTAAQVPHHLTLTRVVVPTHRGKRGFEINAADTLLQECEARDVYTLTGQDSSALGILNTTGRIAVIGGVYEGGSECVLVGGDVLKLTDTIAPTDLLFRGVRFSRPLSWKTDGVTRVIKNLFELKTGHRVRVEDCVMDGCWKDGQDGWAIMLTPTRGGSLVDVVFERVTVTNVGGGINLTGIDVNWPTPAPRTTGVVFRDCAFTISKKLYGGLGRLLMLTGTGTVDLVRVTATNDGGSAIYQYGEALERLTVTESAFTAGTYGVNIAGKPNASNWAAGVQTLNVRGNTIRGAAAALKTNLPDNTYV